MLWLGRIHSLEAILSRISGTAFFGLQLESGFYVFISLTLRKARWCRYLVGQCRLHIADNYVILFQTKMLMAVLF